MGNSNKSSYKVKNRLNNSIAGSYSSKTLNEIVDYNKLRSFVEVEGVRKHQNY